MIDVSMKLDGYQLATITDSWGDLVVTDRRNGGCQSAEWTMDVGFNTQHPAIRRGASVEIIAGTKRWVGTLGEFDLIEGTFAADGLWRKLEGFVCLTLENKRTTNPNTALFWANGRGSGISTIETFSDVTESGESDTFNSVADLLDAWCQQQAGTTHWHVDVNGVLWKRSNATTPQWTVPVGDGLLGVADEEYVTNWYVAYYSKTTHRYEYVTAADDSQGVGRYERMADLTPLGAITATRAQDIANNLLAKTKARTGWTNGLTLNPGQILNMGGVVADLSMPKPAEMVRLQGLNDQRGLSATTDIVIEETIWKPFDNELVINPVGLADRDFSKIVESFGGRLA